MKKDTQYIVALGLLGAGVGGYLWYAKKNDKWPYEPEAPTPGAPTPSTTPSKKKSTTPAPAPAPATASPYAQAKKIYDSLKNGKEIFKKTSTSSKPYYLVNKAYTPANVSGTLIIPAGMVDTKKFVLKTYTTSNKLVFMLSGGQYYYLFDANGFTL